MSLTFEEQSFGETVAGIAQSLWGNATAAPTADLLELWKTGALKGWFQLGSADALGAAIAATRSGPGRVPAPGA